MADLGFGSRVKSIMLNVGDLEARRLSTAISLCLPVAAVTRIGLTEDIRGFING